MYIMSNTRFRQIPLHLSLLLPLLAACQASAPASTPADEPAALVRLRLEIGDARCTADAECRTVAVGQRPCGGPAQWWAWSSVAGSNEATLRALSIELAAVQRAQNERSGLMSTCQVLPDPGAACQAGRCTIRSRPMAN
jgi:hypothetical protein